MSTFSGPIIVDVAQAVSRWCHISLIDTRALVPHLPPLDTPLVPKREATVPGVKSEGERRRRRRRDTKPCTKPQKARGSPFDTEKDEFKFGSKHDGVRERERDLEHVSPLRL